MATTIDDFVKYTEYFSFRNNYDIKLQLPNISQSDLPQIVEFTKTIRIFARSTSIPSLSLTNKIQRIANKKRSTPLQVDYDSVTITFFDTKNLSLRTFFDKWVKARYSKDGSLKYYPEDFASDMSISMYDKKVYTLDKIYPTQVGDVRLDDTSTNEYGTFDVTFFVGDIISESGDFNAQ